MAYVVGRTAQSEKKMRHVGAIIGIGKGSVESKIEAFRRAGVNVTSRPSEIVSRVREALEQRQ